MEFIEWLSLYKTWLSLHEKYQQMINRQSIAIQIKTTVMAQHEQSTLVAY
jgi:exoribonuclease II